MNPGMPADPKTPASTAEKPRRSIARNLVCAILVIATTAGIVCLVRFEITRGTQGLMLLTPSLRIGGVSWTGIGITALAFGITYLLTLPLYRGVTLSPSFLSMALRAVVTTVFAYVVHRYLVFWMAWFYIMFRGPTQIGSVDVWLLIAAEMTLIYTAYALVIYLSARLAPPGGRKNVGKGLRHGSK